MGLPKIVDFIDQVISDLENEDLIPKVKKQVNEMMGEFPMFTS